MLSLDYDILHDPVERSGDRSHERALDPDITVNQSYCQCIHLIRFKNLMSCDFSIIVCSEPEVLDHHSCIVRFENSIGLGKTCSFCLTEPSVIKQNFIDEEILICYKFAIITYPKY